MKNSEKQDYDFVGISVKKKVYAALLRKKAETAEAGKVSTFTEIIGDAIGGINDSHP